MTLFLLVLLLLVRVTSRNYKLILLLLVGVAGISLLFNYIIMSRKAIFGETGKFLGYIYISGGEVFYAPVRGVSDSELASYCDTVLV